jgi:hypothetical protein
MLQRNATFISPVNLKKKRQGESLDAELTVAFPGENLWGQNVVTWKTKIGDVVEEEIGAADLHRLKEAVCAKYGIFIHDKDKNSLFIGYLMAEAWEQGKKSPTLEKLCRTIIEFAKSASAVEGNAVAVISTPLAHTEVEVG